MKWVDFQKPTSFAEAREMLLAEPGAIPVAGCTAFHFMGEASGKTAVLLAGIEGATHITQSAGQMHIGAAASITDVLEHENSTGPLARVAETFASHQLRSVSTLGGNVVRVFPWADFPVALLALDAAFTLLADDETTVGADDFFVSQPANRLSQGELLTAIQVPALQPGTGFGYIKQRMKSESFSLSTAAVRVELGDGVHRSLRIALGAALAFPQRLRKLEEQCAGWPAKPLDTEQRATIAGAMKDLPMLTKEGMSREYIGELAAVTVADAWDAAIQDAAQQGETP